MEYGILFAEVAQQLDFWLCWIFGFWIFSA
jgi:hypothetical protein